MFFEYPYRFRYKNPENGDIFFEWNNHSHQKWYDRQIPRIYFLDKLKKYPVYVDCEINLLMDDDDSICLQKDKHLEISLQAGEQHKISVVNSVMSQMKISQKNNLTFVSPSQ